MANTTNLDLEPVDGSEVIATTFIAKINSNNEKIDTAYGNLKANLMDLTGEDNLTDAINEYSTAFHNAVDRYTSVGDATASDIKSGKKALVQGVEVTGTAFGTTTTATAEDIKTGKTVYDNLGNLITGTLIPKNCEVATATIQGNRATSVTFNFTKDITNARIIYISKPDVNGMALTYNSYYHLVHYDSNDANKWYCSTSGGRSYYVYDYIVNNYYSMTRNGNSVTFSSTSSSYHIGAYDSNTVTGLCIAIWE